MNDASAFLHTRSARPSPPVLCQDNGQRAHEARGHMDFGGQRTDQVAILFGASCHRTNVFTVIICFFSQLLFPGRGGVASSLRSPAPVRVLGRVAATEKTNTRY